MIDTIDLLFPLDKKYSTEYLKSINKTVVDPAQNYVLDAEVLLKNISIPIADEESIRRFLDPYDNRRYIPSPKREHLEGISPGIIKLCFFRAYGKYYLNIVLRLESLLEGRHTNKLYIASEYNNYVLYYAFADIMIRLFPCLKDEMGFIDHNSYNKRISIERLYDPNVPLESYGLARLPFMQFASVRRIDYTVNFKVKHELKAEILQMLKGSFLSKRNLRQTSFNNNNTYAKSKSVVFDIYDKALKISTFPESYGANFEELLEEAKDVIRYEITIKKPKKDWAFKHRSIDKLYSIARPFETTDKDRDLLLLPFLLNEEIAWNCLREYYDLCIGQMPWVNKYAFDKAVKAANLNRRTKQDIEDFAQLCSSLQSVGSAYEAVGTGIQVGRGAKRHTIGPHSASVTPKKFCDTTVKNIRSLGIQPLRLPVKSKRSILPNLYDLNTVALIGGNYYLDDIDIAPGIPFNLTQVMELQVNIDTLFNANLSKTSKFENVQDLILYQKSLSHYRSDNGRLKKRYWEDIRANFTDDQRDAVDDFDYYYENEVAEDDIEELTYEEYLRRRIQERLKASNERMNKELEDDLL